MPPGGDHTFVFPHPRGVNRRTYQTELPAEDYAMIRNFQWADGSGAFVSRNGLVAFNSTLPVASKPVRGGTRWHFISSASVATKEVVMVAGTDIWYSQGQSTGSFASMRSGVTENKDWSFAAYLDVLYMCNGTDAMLRRNGAFAGSVADSVRAAGFPAPATAPTTAAGAAGVLTGTAYQYKITFIYDSNAAHESSAGPASTPLAVTNQKIDLTAIPVGAAGSGVSARTIWRTDANGGAYGFIATINDNTTTIYTDNIADNAAARLATFAPTDNGTPPAGRFNVMWRGRHVVARTAAFPQRVFFSAITSGEKSPGGGSTVHGYGVEIFPASHFLDVGDDNRPIMGLAVWNDLLVIFKEDAIWTVYGDDGQDMQVFRAQSNVGCIAPKTIVNMPDGVYFLGRNDASPVVARFAGGPVEVMSGPIEPYLNDVLLGLYDISEVSADGLNQPCAGRYRGAYMLTYMSASSADRTTVILDLNGPPRWMFWNNIEPNVYIPFDGLDEIGLMFYGSREQARIIRIAETLATDNDSIGNTDVAGYIETGWMGFDHPFHLKQLNWIDIYGQVGHSGHGTPLADTTFTMERCYDFEETTTTKYNSDTINVTDATKVMSRKLWKHRIHPGGSEQTVPEVFYRMKMKMTTSGPIEIFKIVVNYSFRPPEETHGQE